MNDENEILPEDGADGAEITEDAEAVFGGEGEKSEPSETDLGEKEGAERAETSELLCELERLRGELDELREQSGRRERMEAELRDFSRFFPDTRAEDIPSEVWSRAESGDSLPGAFALYRYECELREKRARELNDKNRKMSTGSLVGGGGEEYYSPEDVKKMSRGQIREHYDDVIESMRHWN